MVYRLGNRTGVFLLRPEAETLISSQALMETITAAQFIPQNRHPLSILKRLIRASRSAFRPRAENKVTSAPAYASAVTPGLAWTGTPWWP